MLLVAGCIGGQRRDRREHLCPTSPLSLGQLLPLLLLLLLLLLAKPDRQPAPPSPAISALPFYRPLSFSVSVYVSLRLKPDALVQTPIFSVKPIPLSIFVTLNIFGMDRFQICSLSLSIFLTLTLLRFICHFFPLQALCSTCSPNDFGFSVVLRRSSIKAQLCISVITHVFARLTSATVVTVLG